MKTEQRAKVVSELGSRLAQAARASVARGAQYAPGEQISADAEGAWAGIAEHLVSLVEIEVREAVAEIRKAIDATA